MNEKELRDYINRRYQVVMKTRPEAAGYQGFKQKRVQAERLWNALTLLEGGDIDGTQELLERG